MSTKLLAREPRLGTTAAACSACCCAACLETLCRRPARVTPPRPGGSGASSTSEPYQRSVISKYFSVHDEFADGCHGPVLLRRRLMQLNISRLVLRRRLSSTGRSQDRRPARENYHAVSRINVRNAREQLNRTRSSRACFRPLLDLQPARHQPTF